ncbi:MAG: hypothetical protein MZU97_02470 [Bacillus subtilis]|nr:hypothetical protein [Bacillus subtilis]
MGICGTWIEQFGENINSTVFEYPVERDLVKTKLFFFCALAHPSVMMRKSLLDKYKLRYSLKQKQAEDFEFWRRCGFYFPIENIPEVLLKYRITPNSKLKQDKDKF